MMGIKDDNKNSERIRKAMRSTNNTLAPFYCLRKDHKKMEGKDEVVGSSLVINNVTRHHAGYYICLADNGFGPVPVQKEVRLEVQCKY